MRFERTDDVRVTNINTHMHTLSDWPMLDWRWNRHMRVWLTTLLINTCTSEHRDQTLCEDDAQKLVQQMCDHNFNNKLGKRFLATVSHFYSHCRVHKSSESVVYPSKGGEVRRDPSHSFSESHHRIVSLRTLGCLIFLNHWVFCGCCSAVVRFYRTPSLCVRLYRCPETENHCPASRRVLANNYFLFMFCSEYLQPSVVPSTPYYRNWVINDF